MATGTVKPTRVVKQTQLTGTTSGTGLILTTSFPISQYTIVGANADGNNSCIVIPFSGNNTYWYFKVVNNGTLGNVANTAFTLTIWYLER